MRERRGGRRTTPKAAPVIEIGQGDEDGTDAATSDETTASDDRPDEDAQHPSDDDVATELVSAPPVLDIVDDADLDEVALPDGKVAKGGGLVRRDALSAYMAETRRHSLLTREEEFDLAVRLQKHGDTQAARRMIEANLRLVVKIAYEYRRAHKNLLDMIQEGNIGLMQAVRKFDPYRGVKLSSYAAYWIRAYILKFILANWRLVKIGTTQAQRKLFFNLRKEREKLEQLGFAPTAALLAEKLDVSEHEVVEMEKRLASPEASLDAPVGSDENGSRTRLDYVASEGMRPDQAVEHNEFSQLLKEKLEHFARGLEGREESIFRERWLTETPLTLQELGDRYGVSRERARQLEKRLLTRLRKYLEDELGTAVDIDAMARD
jgi:RNA polymerase sigma-32 factor